VRKLIWLFFLIDGAGVNSGLFLALTVGVEEAKMLLSLPPEVLERVAELLQPPDLSSLLLASSRLYSLLSQPRYWAHAKIRYAG